MVISLTREAFLGISWMPNSDHLGPSQASSGLFRLRSHKACFGGRIPWRMILTTALMPILLLLQVVILDGKQTKREAAS